MRKKILHIITGLEVGGAETNLSRLLPELQKKLNNQVCCLGKEGPISEKIESKGVSIKYLYIKSVFDFFNPWVIFRFRKIVKDFEPDVIETYLIHSDLFGRIWGRVFGVKKIICNHRGSLLQWKWLAIFDKLTSFLVTKYIFQTKAAQEETIKKFRIKKEKTSVIPNVINLEDFELTIDRNEKLKELGIKEDGINVVSVSNLRIGKGHRYLIKALERTYEREYGRRYEKINLIIVGNGEERENLEQQARSSEAKDNIYFLGKRSDVLEILKISDIFVLPTFYEGMSNAIMEAMASGLPVITTDIDVNKDLIRNNYSGFLVPVANSEKIEKKLIELIENPEKRKEIGEKAKRDIEEKCSIEKISSKLFSLLESI